jgi:catechol 2,3-dioxygenase-like lactoylglutathione lyase family enzyme
VAGDVVLPQKLINESIIENFLRKTEHYGEDYMGIFTHICIGSNDRHRSARFYDAALAPLGIHNLGSFQKTGISYGRTAAEFLVLAPDNGLIAAPGNGGTIGFKARSRAAVDAFHAAGLANGGTDEGAPGPRFAVPDAYGAYLRDPDGHKICAYIFGPDRT